MDKFSPDEILDVVFMLIDAGASEAEVFRELVDCLLSMSEANRKSTKD